MGRFGVLNGRSRRDRVPGREMILIGGLSTGRRGKIVFGVWTGWTNTPNWIEKWARKQEQMPI